MTIYAHKELDARSHCPGMVAENGRRDARVFRCAKCDMTWTPAAIVQSLEGSGRKRRTDG